MEITAKEKELTVKDQQIEETKENLLCDTLMKNDTLVDNKNGTTDSTENKVDVNLLKSSLQKLGDIACQYQPACCNGCGKSGPFSWVTCEDCNTVLL